MGKQKPSRAPSSIDEALRALRRVYAEHFARVRADQRLRTSMHRRRKSPDASA